VSQSESAWSLPAGGDPIQPRHGSLRINRRATAPILLPPEPCPPDSGVRVAHVHARAGLPAISSEAGKNKKQRWAGGDGQSPATEEAEGEGEGEGMGMGLFLLGRMGGLLSYYRTSSSAGPADHRARPARPSPAALLLLRPPAHRGAWPAGQPAAAAAPPSQ
jgi:hypothetical protein